jgi:hypothetical protein
VLWQGVNRRLDDGGLPHTRAAGRALHLLVVAGILLAPSLGLDDVLVLELLRQSGKGMCRDLHRHLVIRCLVQI